MIESHVQLNNATVCTVTTAFSIGWNLHSLCVWWILIYDVRCTMRRKRYAKTLALVVSVEYPCSGSTRIGHLLEGTVRRSSHKFIKLQWMTYCLHTLLPPARSMHTL